MASFNKVILCGNVTKDIELRYVGSGSAVCDLGLAVNEKYKKGEEWVEEVSYIDCVLWGRTAEIANEYSGKGSNVMVEGRLKQESWEKDGQKHYKIKVIVEKLVLLGSKKDGGSQGDSPKPQQQRPQSTKQPQRQSAPAQHNDDHDF